MATLVTIVMPVFNAGSLLYDSVRSCINQTNEDWELIAVDDGSTDRSREVIASFGDSRISLIELGSNRGPSEARNVALDHASGQWITFLDADDAFRSDRLSRLLAISDRNPSADVIFDALHRWHGVESIPNTVMLAPEFDKEFQLRSVTPELWIREFCYAKPFIRSSLIGEKIRFATDIYGSQDTVFFLRCLAATSQPGIHVDLPLYIYRNTPGSIVANKARHVSDSIAAVEQLEEIFQSDEPVLAALEDRKVSLNEDRFMLDIKAVRSMSQAVGVARELASNPRMFKIIPRRFRKSVSAALQRRRHVSKQRRMR